MQLLPIRLQWIRNATGYDTGESDILPSSILLYFSLFYTMILSFSGENTRILCYRKLPSFSQHFPEPPFLHGVYLFFLPDLSTEADDKEDKKEH